MDIEAVAADDNLTDEEDEEEDGASFLIKKIIVISHLIVGFIDDQTPIASGSGTQQHWSWNSLQNGEGLEEFLAGIYERSRSHRMRPVENTTDPHNCIRSLPGAEEFPLWRIKCRVSLSL